ncbi:hypothetical protein [Priestia filamentosa]|uniref:hypothetical protein n=1 Tax=Priestia filamentosa TaxID=1402861 RepID=UPI0002EDB852|nr:hypothetical protein [Priestia filamentosa]
MADFLLKLSVYIAVFACVVPLVDGSSSWLTFLAFLIAIFVADMVIKIIKKIWNSFPNE